MGEVAVRDMARSLCEEEFANFSEADTYGKSKCRTTLCKFENGNIVVKRSVDTVFQSEPTS